MTRTRVTLQFDKAFLAHGMAGGRLAALELHQAVMDVFGLASMDIMCMIFWSVVPLLDVSLRS